MMLDASDRPVHDGAPVACWELFASMTQPSAALRAYAVPWAASNGNSLVLCARTDLSAFGAENLQGVSRRIALTEEGCAGTTRQHLAVYRH